MSEYLISLRSKKYYFLKLSLISGFLLSISWYKPFTPLAFIAFIPLLELEYGIYNSSERYPKLKFFAYSYLSIVLWNIGVYWWLWYASQETTLAAWGANALLQVLPLVAFQITKRASKDKYSYFAFIVYWIAFEFTHLHWDLSWVWLNMGNVFANFPEWVQWYEFTGSFGGTIWVLWVNVLAYKVLYHNIKKLKLALLLLLPAIYSYITFYTYEEKGKDIEIVVVQPNLDCYTEKFSFNTRSGRVNLTQVPYNVQVERFVKLSESVMTPNTRFVVWPETSLHKGIEETATERFSDFKIIRTFINKYANASLITGVDSYIRFKDDESLSKTARYSKYIGYYDKFNSALFISDKDSIEFYNKSKLVIGAETIPFATILNPIMLNLGGTSGQLGTQQEREVFTNSERSAAGSIICYESIYGEFVTEYVKKGATFLLIITNDGWWENTPGHIQHLRFGALRSIETRKSIARAANTGISGFINQKGEIFQSSVYGEMIAMNGKIKENNYQTFYVKYGDYLGRLATFLSVFMFLAAFVKKRLDRKRYFKHKVINSLF